MREMEPALLRHSREVYLRALGLAQETGYSRDPVCRSDDFGIPLAWNIRLRKLRPCSFDAVAVTRPCAPHKHSRYTIWSEGRIHIGMANKSAQIGSRWSRQNES
jgi:hypothetical protein